MSRSGALEPERRVRLAVVGLGRLGEACARAALARDDVTLVGVVRPRTSAFAPDWLHGAPIAPHVSGLPRFHAALVCVPPERSAEVTHELLAHSVPLVECAALSGAALVAHHAGIARVAAHHRVPAVVGAGWEPGMLDLLRGLLALLVPHARTDERHGASAHLHHTLAARRVPGVRDALCTEDASRGGRRARYVYVELEPGAAFERIEAALRADPLFANEETVVLPTESVAALASERQGIVLERRGTTGSGAHGELLVEARFDRHALAAEVMVAAGRIVGTLDPGAHALGALPPSALATALPLARAHVGG